MARLRKTVTREGGNLSKLSRAATLPSGNDMEFGRGDSGGGAAAAPKPMSMM